MLYMKKEYSVSIFAHDPICLVTGLAEKALGKHGIILLPQVAD